LLYISKQITNDYDNLILLIVPKNKEGLKSDFNIKTLKNFAFLLFKR